MDENTDKNIGREWNSQWGIQVISERLKFNSGDMYEVKSVDSNTFRRYSVDKIEDVIKRNEFDISPEGLQKRAARDLEYRKQEEIHKQNEAIKAQAEVEKHEIDGFGLGLTPMQLGKAKATLSKPIQLNGEYFPTLKEAVRKLVANGGALRILQEDVVKPMSRLAYHRADYDEQSAHEKKVREGGKKNVYCVSDYDLGKIAYDYAEYLISNNKEAELSKKLKENQTIRPTNLGAKTTPQVLSNKSAEDFIKIAADSIQALRKQDVERVLNEAPAHYKLSLANYIKDNRKDLVDEVNDIQSEADLVASTTPEPSM